MYFFSFFLSLYNFIKNTKFFFGWGGVGYGGQAGAF
jgi:hypothetical protein